MSSTNRSKARDAHKSDYYVTPVNSIIDFIYNVDLNHGLFSEDLKYLDCCAGGSEKEPMSYPTAIKAFMPNADIDTIDIREDSLADIKGDYLKIDCKDKYDVIITNPPFFLAQEIIEKALDDVKYGGYVIMLLRLNFFGSKQRKEFWENNMPIETYIHHKRMSFTEDGATDSIEYCHMVWQKGVKQNYTKTYII